MESVDVVAVLVETEDTTVPVVETESSVIEAPPSLERMFNVAPKVRPEAVSPEPDMVTVMRFSKVVVPSLDCRPMRALPDTETSA